jgi:hypothetical protein
MCNFGLRRPRSTFHGRNRWGFGRNE